MLTEVQIDPNVRVAGNQTRSGFEDVKGGPIPTVGQRVVVREPESHIIGYGEVTRVMPEQRLIYLAVNWKALVPERLLTSAELLEEVRRVVDVIAGNAPLRSSGRTGATAISHYDEFSSPYDESVSKYISAALTA